MPSYEDFTSSASATTIGQEQIAEIKQGKKDGGIKIVARNNHVTSTRLPAIYADQFIEDPGLARANVAVSVDRPDGDGEWASKVKEYTPLQQHVLFWDRDGDGQIFPRDVYVGLRELGFNILFSILATLIIHTGVSYPTRLAHSWVPDPWCRIYVSSIHKAKHGSDSGTYDPEGRFVPQAFENLFSKFDGDNDGALTLRELFTLVHGHRCVADPYGWIAAFLEWITTWLLIQKNGKVYKEDLRGVYDGSIFWKIREARLSDSGWRQGLGIKDVLLGGPSVADKRE